MPSTRAADVAYDPETQTLSVWFRPSGPHHDHAEVPSVAFDALGQSPSAGRYFNAHMPNGYEFILSERGFEPHFSDRIQNIARHRHAGTR